MTKRAEKGRATFYSRDSGGKHEQTPAEYVRWAIRKCMELGVKFTGTPELINAMISNGEPVNGDIYFDYCVPGDEMSRPALDALRAQIKRDPSISHLLIPRRDRLARPSDPQNGMQLEVEFRRQGITIVFMNATLTPLKKGQRIDLPEAIAAHLEYDTSGRFLDELAEKMILAQRRLAEQGYSTGGRAPFGFRRFLIKSDGTIDRQLDDKEIVRREGHHVVWLPGPAQEIELLRRIREMLKTMPATRVCKILNSEGVPSPDAGRSRTDSGVQHLVSGIWHQSTVTGIGRNKLLTAVMSYGKRSMGKGRRVSPEGPRKLDDSDWVDDKPKVIRNANEVVTRAPAHFDQIVSEQEQDELEKILDARAGTQRGKPRSRDSERNPLGGRTFDMDCTWPMYRAPYRQSFRYVCGRYQQSHGQECHHNHIDGVEASRFGLAAIQQRLLNPGMLERLQKKLKEKALLEGAGNENQGKLAELRTQLGNANAKRDRAGRNLAFAENEAQYKAVSKEFESLEGEVNALTAEISQLEQASDLSLTPEQEVSASMRLIERLPDLAKNPNNLGDIGRLFSAVNHYCPVND